MNVYEIKYGEGTLDFERLDYHVAAETFQDALTCFNSGRPGETIQSIVLLFDVSVAAVAAPPELAVIPPAETDKRADTAVVAYFAGREAVKIVEEQKADVAKNPYCSAMYSFKLYKAWTEGVKAEAECVRWYLDPAYPGGALEQGRAAKRAWANASDCLYRTIDKRRDLWMTGWHQAKRDAPCK